MKNLKILLAHEFLQQVKSFKFILMVTLSLIVTLFTVYVQVTDFKERFQNYEAEKLKATEEAGKAGTFAELNVPVIIPPNPLSIFSKGFDEKAGNKIKISVEDLPELETIAQKKNPFMAVFINFDIVSIVKIILSLMAIFLIADSIAGEREEQTLKMIFINRVNRLEFFIAKYIAALTAISIPLFAIFLFSSFYISIQPSIQLSINFWLMLLLIFLSSLGFLSVFVFLGLWISIKASSSAQVMIYGLLVWMLVVFIYPDLANYTVSKVIDVPSSEELKADIDRIYNEYGVKLIEDHEKNYPKGRYYFSYMFQGSKIMFINKDNWVISLPSKQGITSKFKLEFDAGQVKRMIPVLLEYQDKMMDTYYDYRNNQLKQKRTASWLQVLMPGYLLDETARSLAGTSYDIRVLSLLKKTRQYRSIYINYINSKNGFGPKYFTQIPQEIWSDDRNDYNPVIDLYNSRDNYPLLNLTDIPEFPTIEKFKVPLELFFLLLINLALLLMVNRAFLSFSIIQD